MSTSTRLSLGHIDHQLKCSLSIIRKKVIKLIALKNIIYFFLTWHLFSYECKKKKKRYSFLGMFDPFITPFKMVVLSVLLKRLVIELL